MSLNLPPLDKPLDALVIAPHPDDAELGMGGTIVKMIRSGLRVGVVDLTNGEPTPHGSLEIRAAETLAATKHLELTWRYNAGMRNRFLEPTLENRATLANIFRATRPKWLFAPYWEDAHPDHTAATQLIEAARFWSKLTKCELIGEPYHPARIFYYYCIHLRLAIQPSFVVDITNEWSAKKASMESYQSQLIKGRQQEWPTFLDRVEHEALNWGRLIGTLYGEPFQTREPLGISSLNGLV
jgi:N-acetylglucosamine malate deacetylase 1